MPSLNRSTVNIYSNSPFSNFLVTSTRFFCLSSLVRACAGCPACVNNSANFRASSCRLQNTKPLAFYRNTHSNQAA